MKSVKKRTSLGGRKKEAGKIPANILAIYNEGTLDTSLAFFFSISSLSFVLVCSVMEFIPLLLCLQPLNDSLVLQVF
jgi:hypothetical protein